MRSDLLCIALLAAVFAGSCAAKADSFKLIVAQDATFDDNFFRLPVGVTPGAVPTGVVSPPRSETVFKTHAGVAFDRSYRRQRLGADFTLTHYAHQAYKYLDSNGISGRAAWNSTIGDRWNGAVSYARAQTPSNDAIQTGFQTAYRLDQRVAGAVDYRWHPAWSAGVGLAKVGNHYNNAVNPFSDYDADVTDAHIAYRSRMGNQLRVLARRTDGNYSAGRLSQTNVPTPSYVQMDYEADTMWVLDGHSRVFGRVGYSGFQYGALAPAFRNFDGPAGRLGYDWTPTEKTAISLVLRRDIGPEPLYYVGTSVVATSAASIAAASALSPKISVRGFVELRTQKLGGETGAFDSSMSNPGYRQFTLTGTWTPERNLLFSVTFGHETRTSNSQAFPHYDDNTASVNVQFSSR